MKCQNPGSQFSAGSVSPVVLWAVARHQCLDLGSNIQVGQRFKVISEPKNRSRGELFNDGVEC